MLLCKYTMTSLIALQSPLPRLKLFLSILMTGSLAWEKSKEKRKKDASSADASRKTSLSVSKQGEGPR